MVVRILGAQALARLMTQDEAMARDLSWLLFGPSETEIGAGEPDADPVLATD